MINLTPHPITILVGDRSVTLPPSGQVARVESIETVEFNIDLGDGVIVPVITRQFGEVQGLPVDGSPCIVSSLVLGAVPGRPDTFAPDTGATAVRNERGQVIAVTRLVSA